MKSYSEEEIFNEKAIKALKTAQGVVERLSDGLRCHEVARIVRAVLRRDGHVAWIVDGHYGPVEHSWLLVSGRKEDDHDHAYVILDPYAVGRLPIVQLVSPSLGLHTLYRPLEKLPLFASVEREDIKHEVIGVELARFGVVAP